MSVLSRISFYQNSRSEIQNQELARDLASTRDEGGIREIAEHLWDKNTNVRSDCLKVLYEIGYISPDLIAPFTDDFIRLLSSKHNRMVWGGMIALSTVAPLKAPTLFGQREAIYKTIENGSIITIDNGIKTLSTIAASESAFSEIIFPYLLNFLGECRPSDLPRHAEVVAKCVTDFNKNDFLSVLHNRQERLSVSQKNRIRILEQKWIPNR
ncbi:MAG: hypothetical protein NTZ74_15085 [Chloroflexi bacterium]|nr:hypothetical protein [Chloroflexota bacterium]